MYEQDRIPATLTSPEAVARAKALLAAAGAASRTAIGRQVCERFGFHDSRGRPQLASCMHSLRALDAAGRIELPALRHNHQRCSARCCRASWDFNAGLALQEPVRGFVEVVCGDVPELEGLAEGVTEGVGGEAAGGGQLGAGLEDAGGDQGDGEVAGAGEASGDRRGVQPSEPHELQGRERRGWDCSDRRVARQARRSVWAAHRTVLVRVGVRPSAAPIQSSPNALALAAGRTPASESGFDGGSDSLLDAPSRGGCDLLQWCSELGETSEPLLQRRRNIASAIASPTAWRGLRPVKGAQQGGLRGRLRSAPRKKRPASR